MTRSPRWGVGGLVAVVTTVAAAGCAQAEIRDVLGMWAATDGTDTADLAAGVVEIEVVFVEGDDGGCWAAVDALADDPAALPVRWPAGTLVGLEATLVLPDETVVEVGDRLRAGGAVLPAARADDPPAGCDVAAGFWSIAEVTPLDDG